MKKICSLFLMAMLVFLAVPVQTRAIDLNGEIVYKHIDSRVEEAQNGSLYWSCVNVRYADDVMPDANRRTLLIEGNGKMRDYVVESCQSNGWAPEAPWRNDYATCQSSHIFVDGGITYVGDSAFQGFGSLLYATLEEGVTEIGDAAFFNCRNLQEITIPETVEKIGEDALAGNPYMRINCVSGSYAHKYAEEMGIKYYLLDKTECENNGHTSYGSATCTEAKACRVCGEVMEQATGHTYVEATCASPKKCTKCGVTTGSTRAHSWRSWSYYYGNYEYRLCNVCNKMETRLASASQKVTSINITGKSTTLLAGKKMTLTAEVSPSNAENKEVTWKSSNKKYATVTANGVVKAKAAGAGKTVTITATAKDGSGEMDTYRIKIKGAVKKIKLKASRKTIKVGKKVTIKATVTVGAGGSKKLNWTSSNKKYATVNAKGVVTAKKAGKGKTVKITARAKDGSGKKATITIKIK